MRWPLHTAAACKIIGAVMITGFICLPAIAQLSLHRPLRMTMEKFTCPTAKEEFDKQEEIYHSKGGDIPEGYVIDRSLLFYKFALPSAFDHTLLNLSPTGRWLDIGAGQGHAIVDYFASRNIALNVDGRTPGAKKGKAIAISIEDRRTSHWHQAAANLEANQIQYFYSRRLHEYSLEELGQFKIITDVMGGFSYTSHLSRFMEKVLGFLELGGSFFTLLQDVASDTVANRPSEAGAPFLTEIVKSDNSDMKVCSWLRNITCVKVTCNIKAGLKPLAEAYHVQKVCNNITVPPLERIHFVAGTPPERRFQVKDSPLIRNITTR